MKGLVAIAVLMLLASFIMEERQQNELLQYSEATSIAWGMLTQQRTITCAPGNEHRPDDTTRCGCMTDIECEHGVRHVDGGEE